MKYFFSAWGVFTLVREVHLSVSDRIRSYRYYPLVGILIGSFFVLMSRVLSIFISSKSSIDLLIMTMLVLVMFPRTVKIALYTLTGLPLGLGRVCVCLWFLAITVLYLTIAPPLKEITLVLMLGLACWGYLLVLCCHADSEERPNLEEMSWATFPILLLCVLCWPLGLFLFLGTLVSGLVFLKALRFYKKLGQKTLASLSVMITELIVLILVFVYHQALYHFNR